MKPQVLKALELLEISQQVIGSYVKKAKTQALNPATLNDVRVKRAKGIQTALKRESSEVEICDGTKDTVQEDLDESVKHYLVGSSGQNLTGHTSQPHFDSETAAREYQKKYKHVSQIKSAKIIKGTSDKHGYVTPITEDNLDERRLTPVELKKREEIAQAIERSQPDMPMSKKMAIATKTAKNFGKMNEEVTMTLHSGSVSGPTHYTNVKLHGQDADGNHVISAYNNKYKSHDSMVLDKHDHTLVGIKAGHKTAEEAKAHAKQYIDAKGYMPSRHGFTANRNKDTHGEFKE